MDEAKRARRPAGQDGAADRVASQRVGGRVQTDPRRAAAVVNDGIVVKQNRLAIMDHLVFGEKRFSSCISHFPKNLGRSGKAGVARDETRTAGGGRGRDRRGAARDAASAVIAAAAATDTAPAALVRAARAAPAAAASAPPGLVPPSLTSSQT